MAAREPSSWVLACHVLRNHFEGEDTCEETVDRLWRTKGGNKHRPRIHEKNCSISLERWDLKRLWSLIGEGDVTEETPHSTGEPPVVVRWEGRDYRIDGRKRINQMHRQRDQGPHPVLIVDIGSAQRIAN